jgi:hypothetical protein
MMYVLCKECQSPLKVPDTFLFHRGGNGVFTFRSKILSKGIVEINERERD